MADALLVPLLVRYALRPLGGFQAEIEARGRGDLSQVGDTALPQELLLPWAPLCVRCSS